MVFSNPQIETSQLPSVRKIDYKKLAPAYMTTEYIGTCILFGFFLIGATVLFFNASPMLGVYRYAIFILWILLFTLSMSLVNMRYNMAGYALRKHDLVYKSGVWWQTITTVPFNRMQHCEISQGPIQNAFNLATLRVFTAGGSSSDLAIDGLAHEEAKLIKDFITGKISGQQPASSEVSVEDSEGTTAQAAKEATAPEPQAPNQPPLSTNDYHS